jgi:queuine tRNA-ribosyltransferase
MPTSLSLPNGPIALPAFLPDATRGTVRGLDARDVANAGIQAVVMNVFHLMQRPGSSTIKALGGIHEMFGWQAPILTDSGGFQAFSLIANQPQRGSITDQGLLFRPEGSKRPFRLTPEKSVQLQLSYGADIAVCLDVCTHVDDPPDVQERAVDRTIAWAKRCKRTFEGYVDQQRWEGPRPMLLGVVQGGGSRDLRRRCADELLEIGFDGYGLGGWPLDADGHLLEDLIGFTRALIPSAYPMHALGVGRPDYVTRCAKLGYDLFDSALPTRDARRGRLLQAENGNPTRQSYLYIHDDTYIKDSRPVDETCDCYTCQHYSRSLLRHLFKTHDPLYPRLATIHNLRHLARTMAALRDTASATPSMRQP